MVSGELRPCGDYLLAASVPVTAGAGVVVAGSCSFFFFLPPLPFFAGSGVSVAAGGGVAAAGAGVAAEAAAAASAARFFLPLPFTLPVAGGSAAGGLAVVPGAVEVTSGWPRFFFLSFLPF